MNDHAKCLSRCLGVALSLLLFPATGVSQTPAADNDCWPAGNFNFSRRFPRRRGKEGGRISHKGRSCPRASILARRDVRRHAGRWLGRGVSQPRRIARDIGGAGRSCARSTYRALFQSRFSTAPSLTIIIRWSSSSFRDLSDCQPTRRSFSFPSSSIAARRWGTIPTGLRQKK